MGRGSETQLQLDEKLNYLNLALYSQRLQIAKRSQAPRCYHHLMHYEINRLRSLTSSVASLQP